MYRMHDDTRVVLADSSEMSRLTHDSNSIDRNGNAFFKRDLGLYSSCVPPNMRDVLTKTQSRLRKTHLNSKNAKRNKSVVVHQTVTHNDVYRQSDLAWIRGTSLEPTHHPATTWAPRGTHRTRRKQLLPRRTLEQISWYPKRTSTSSTKQSKMNYP
jgi:hypothetical protein